MSCSSVSTVDEALELLGGVFDLRREEILRQQLEGLDLVRDGDGVFHDDLAGSLLAEVRKLLEHIVRGAEVERHVLVRVGEALRAEHDVAVDLLLGVEEMHVAGGDDGLSHLAAEGEDAAV